MTNYTYENSGGTPLRPLLTGMSWSVPQGSGIPVPASVTMAYDNAGNRTQMTDGLGSVTYEYDDLSRLTSESRYFSDLPSAPVPNNRYTIGYSYGLSGNLTGYTDPFGESIDYAQDRRGRLASVTGSSYGGVTNYLGSPGYRAWGPLKELEYGNGLELNVTFNDRLLAETFEIKHPTDTDKKIFGKEYEYYSDGRLKYTKENFQDQQVKRLDRSFSYDHLARVKDAKSGVEASGGTQTNLLLLPYRQNYSYDAFGMLTGRQSTLWTEENWDFSDSFVNNRRTSGWVYDHHGNATYAEQINYEYDSTNMMTKTWRAQSHEMTIGHDGVGREGKRSHRSWDSEEEEWGDWETRYFVHSTVLGQTLTELSETGTKVRTFVVAAGTVVARQFYDSGSNEAVSWELADASGQSIRMTNAAGGYTDVDSGSAELDALGNNVGTHGSLSDPRNSEGEVSPANRSTVSADAFCSRAGVVGPCWIVSLLNRGQTMGSKGSDLPMEMVGDSNPASLSRHPFYFAFYRNSLEAAEDDGRWIQTDWDVTYEENLSGTNDSSVTIIGRVNAMTFIPPASPAIEQVRITNEQIEAALNKCLQEIWPAPTGYLRTISGFFPTRRGISGSVWYTTTSVSGPSFTVQRETKKILNDVNSFSRQQLTEIYNEVFPGQKKKMLIGMALWNQKPVRGMSFSANHNFTANDLPERSSNGGLAGLVGLHVAVQVHELGNSIELMTGAYRGNPRAADPDSGDVYERCVYQELR